MQYSMYVIIAIIVMIPSKDDIHDCYFLSSLPTSKAVLENTADSCVVDLLED